MVNRLPDYRLVEEYENTRFAREAAERKKIRQAKATEAWSEKYGADYAKRKARNRVITKTLTPAEAAKIKTQKPKPPLGNIKQSDQLITAKGVVGPNRKTVGNKVVGKVAGEVSPVAKNIIKPVYTGVAGQSQTYIGTSITNPNTGATTFTPKGDIDKIIAKKTAKKTTGKAIVKLAAKGATRLIPGIGTALLIKDVYDVNKWATSQPKKKKKDANIYGTVSKNNIYKGY